MDVMPNLSDMAGDGLYSIRPSIPEVSSVSWSTIITGLNPGSHGVFGFTEFIPGTYSLSYHNIRKLRASPFWMDGSRRYFIVNVPATFPAQPLNGFIVTGFVSPDLSRSVYPGNYISLLREIDYRIDVDTSLIERSRNAFIKDLFDCLGARVKLFRYLWDMSWDVFMLVITGSDRLGHFLWDSFLDDGDRFHDAFIQFYRAIDFLIGDIVKGLSEDDRFIILSDHGMELKKVNVNLNKLLMEERYLKVAGGSGRFSDIIEGSIAFTLDPGRIYLNYVDRYPRGSVKVGDRDRILDDLTDLFIGLKYGGERVIKAVYRGEDIYSGPYVKDAPDLVLIPESGYSLSGRLDVDSIFDRDSLSGTHNYDAFLYVNGDLPPDVDNDNLSVEDVLKVCGLV